MQPSEDRLGQYHKPNQYETSYGGLTADSGRDEPITKQICDSPSQQAIHRNKTSSVVS